MTILLHDLKHTVVGDANEDCVSKARQIRFHSEPFFSSDCIVQAKWFKVIYEPFFNIDCTVEAGYQVAEIGACVLLDLA